MKILTSYLFILLNSLTIYAQLSPVLSNTAYNTGEKLEYLAYYGFFDGGTASVSIEEAYIDGELVHYGKAVAQTIGWVHTMYNVYDVYESYFNPETGLPIKAIMDVQEGDTYKRYNEVTFNHDENYVISQRKGEEKIEVVANTLDMVSAFYFIRRGALSNLNEGDVIYINTYFQDKPWELIIRYEGKETLTLDLGEVECLRFKPVVEVINTFEDEDALTIWISDDENYIPVRAEMELFVGSVKVDLVKYSGLQNEFNIELDD